jgi:hypothetical protein
MQDANTQTPNAPDSDSDATSKETLEDLEKSEQDPEPPDASDDSQLPSPDGERGEGQRVNGVTGEKANG